MQLKRGSCPDSHISFMDDFLCSTQDVSNPDILPSSRNTDNFRQIGKGLDAVVVDLAHITHGFTIRDFKSASMERGNGSAALSFITGLADKNRVRLELRAVADVSFSSGKRQEVIPQRKLIQLYERHRFFLLPKDNRDSIGPIMIRPPQHQRFGYGD